MADNTELRCRIAALETELRLTKEQLAAAHGGTVCLANAMAGQVNTQQQATEAALRGQIQTLQESNYRLQLAFDQCVQRAQPKSLLDEPWGLGGQYAGNGWERVGAGASGWRTVTGGVQEDRDLMTFNTKHQAVRNQDEEAKKESDGLESGSDQASGTAAKTLGARDAVECEQDDPFGLGVSGAVLRHGNGEVGQVGEQTREDDAKDMQILGTDGQTFQVSIPAEASLPSNAPVRPVARRAVYFYDGEHRKLSGVAWLVEQLSGEEVDCFWRDYARKHSGHSAHEWREYYEVNIRPGYLSRNPVSPVEESEEVRSGAMGAVDGVSLDRKQNDSVLSHKASVQPNIGDSFKAALEPNDDMNDAALLDDRQEQPKTPNILPNLAQVNRPKASLPLLLGDPAQLEEARAFMSTATRGGDKQRVRNEQRGKWIEEVTRDEGALTARTVHYRRCSSLDIKTLDVKSPVLKGAEQAVESDKSEGLSPHAKAQLSAQEHNEAPRGPRYSPATGFERQAYLPAEQRLFFAQGVDDLGLSRTVVISNLPANMPVRILLAKISGGPLVKVQYLNTAGMRCRASEPGAPSQVLDTSGVMLEFLGSNNAHAFVEHHKNVPLSFTSADGRSHTVHITLVKTATRPIPSGILAAYHSPDIRMSRAVFVLDPKRTANPDQLASTVNIYQHVRYPLRVEADENGIIELEFWSMADAGVAMRALKGMGRLDGWQVGYLPDPCAGKPEVRRMMGGEKAVEAGAGVEQAV